MQKSNILGHKNFHGVSSTNSLITLFIGRESMEQTFSVISLQLIPMFPTGQSKRFFTMLKKITTREEPIALYYCSEMVMEVVDPK